MCDRCAGEGSVPCPNCGGRGLVNVVDDEDARAEGRRNFTAAQLVSLGKAGKALWLDGHWAYPTPMRSDYDNAVKAVGQHTRQEPHNGPQAT